jgi:hypothetical protein
VSRRTLRDRAPVARLARRSLELLNVICSAVTMRARLMQAAVLKDLIQSVRVLADRPAQQQRD